MNISLGSKVSPTGTGAPCSMHGAKPSRQSTGILFFQRIEGSGLSWIIIFRKSLIVLLLLKGNLIRDQVTYLNIIQNWR